MYAAALTEKDMLTEKQLNEINILDEVVIVGYPDGEASTHHKFPLFSKGYVASLPKDTVEDGEGFLNIPAIGGFSGAPVFLNTTGLKFLGMLVSGITEGNSNASGMCKYVPGMKYQRKCKTNRRFKNPQPMVVGFLLPILPQEGGKRVH